MRTVRTKMNLAVGNDGVTARGHRIKIFSLAIRVARRAPRLVISTTGCAELGAGNQQRRSKRGLLHAAVPSPLRMCLAIGPIDPDAVTEFTAGTPENERGIRKSLTLLYSVHYAHWSSAAPGVGTYLTSCPTSALTMTGSGAGKFVPSNVTVTGIPTSADVGVAMT